MSGPHSEHLPAAATEPAPTPTPVPSSREWLERGRGTDPDAGRAVPRPQPPSRRFTWGVRAGVIAAALFYGVLTVWGRLDAHQPVSMSAEVLFGLAVLVAAVALIEVWCSAGRPRFSASQSEAITADLSLAQKQTVRRMARGRRGPEVVELRARAAASAWAQRQNNAVAPAPDTPDRGRARSCRSRRDPLTGSLTADRLTATGLRLPAYGYRLTAYGLRLPAYGYRLTAWRQPSHRRSRYSPPMATNHLCVFSAHALAALR